MSEAFICDYIRTQIGRFGGQLASVRTDDLGAIPLKALVARTGGVGCAGRAWTPPSPPPAPSRRARPS